MRTLKQIKIFVTIIIFALSFVCHFMYDWFPNIITSIFFPVNESIWEHMKIIYTSICIASIIEYYIYKIKKIQVNNFLISIPIISIIGIVIYLTIYLIIDIFIPHNLIISITLLFLIFILCEILSYYILQSPKIKNQQIIGSILIIISYFIFTLLTFYPPHNYLFIDTTNNTYGVNIKRN
jgi:hypothetical protein